MRKHITQEQLEENIVRLGSIFLAALLFIWGFLVLLFLGAGAIIIKLVP